VTFSQPSVRSQQLTVAHRGIRVGSSNYLLCPEVIVPVDDGDFEMYRRWPRADVALNWKGQKKRVIAKLFFFFAN
jgi:hypothetical protein